MLTGLHLRVVVVQIVGTYVALGGIKWLFAGHTLTALQPAEGADGSPRELASATANPCVCVSARV